MKAQLFILGGRDVGRSFDIDENAVLGRAPECEVRLRDRSISRKHAVVRFTGEGWVVEDLGSRNGIRFRDRRVPDARLKDHDEFVLGDLPIRFRSPVPGEAEAPSPVVEPVVEPAVAPAVAPVVAPVVGGEIELEDEIELEEEIDLGATGVATAPRRAPVRLEPLVETAEKVEELSEYEQRRAQLLRESRSTSFLRGDLSQRPFWFKVLVGILVTAMALGVSFLAFRIMQMLRGGP